MLYVCLLDIVFALVVVGCIAKYPPPPPLQTAPAPLWHAFINFSSVHNWINVCTVDLINCGFYIAFDYVLQSQFDHLTRSSVPIGLFPMTKLTHFLIMFCAYDRGSLQCWMLRAYLNVSNPHLSVRVCVLCWLQRWPSHTRTRVHTNLSYHVVHALLS